MTSIKVIFYSKSHNVEKVSEQVAIGAKSVVNTEIDLISCDKAITRIDELNQADAIIFGSPTYFGSLPAEMKEFLDTLGQVWMSKKWENKICAAFTHSSSPSGDKLMTLMQIMTFAMQNGMIWVGNSLLPNEKIAIPEEWSDLGSGVMSVNILGSWIGMMSQSSQGEEIDKSHFFTARLFGRRIAEIVHKFKS